MACIRSLFVDYLLLEGIEFKIVEVVGVVRVVGRRFDLIDYFYVVVGFFGIWAVEVGLGVWGFLERWGF